MVFKMKVSLANWFTAVRVFLAFPIFFLLMRGTSSARASALILFCLAGLTDYFDGKIARVYGQITRSGKFFDPIADKILVISVLTGLGILKEIPLWMVILIVTREIFVTFLRVSDVEKFSPTILAKSKTAFQICGIAIMLFIPLLNLGIQQLLTKLIMTSILLVTIISGIPYFLRAWRKI